MLVHMQDSLGISIQEGGEGRGREGRRGCVDTYAGLIGDLYPIQSI